MRGRSVTRTGGTPVIGIPSSKNIERATQATERTPVIVSGCRDDTCLFSERMAMWTLSHDKDDKLPRQTDISDKEPGAAIRGTLASWITAMAAAVASADAMLSACTD